MVKRKKNKGAAFAVPFIIRRVFMKIYYMPYGTTQEEINKLRKSINEKIIVVISGNDDFKTNLKDFIVAAKK